MDKSVRQVDKDQLAHLAAQDDASIREAELASVEGDGYLLTNPHHDGDGDTAEHRFQADEWKEFEAWKAAQQKNQALPQPQVRPPLLN
jgi:hypothetical protein